MTKVIVERGFAVPTSDADLAAFASRRRNCLGVRRVQREADGPFASFWIAGVP